ncbi:MAG: hypothetical protein RR672_10110, partial [Raoultibacter sp.]
CNLTLSVQLKMLDGEMRDHDYRNDYRGNGGEKCETDYDIWSVLHEGSRDYPNWYPSEEWTKKDDIHRIDL